MRQEFKGIGASRGTALGRARVRLPHALDIEEVHIDESQVEAEIAKMHDAITHVRSEMDALRGRLTGALVKEMGEFLDLHALILDDPELIESLDKLIRTRLIIADYALKLQRDKVTQIFSTMDDTYLRARVDDIDLVLSRILAALHRQTAKVDAKVGEILVAENVAPSELQELVDQGVIAIVTVLGSMLSHTAILARSMNLPLVVGAVGVLKTLNDGDTIVCDGGTGLVVVEPDAADLRAHRQRDKAYLAEQKQLDRLRRVPTVTTDGVEVLLYANAESNADVTKARRLGATGIGLYRTEFLFLQSADLPTEEEQFRAYRDVVLGMAGRPVTIRTLDIGADKADRTGLALRNEPNPALGLRGVRLSMMRTGLLETQLRALLRASGYGPVRILVPMVSSREEVVHIKREIKRLSTVLREEGHAVAAQIALGAMIEVPAAAIALSTFIKLVDFVSIGTNDLVQYILAVDRNNEAIGNLFTPLHPAVLKLMHQTIRLAQKHGRKVSVCGEMAGDATFTFLLLSLGLREFSLHPTTLLEIRQKIRSANFAELEQHGKRLLRATSTAGIERWMNQFGGIEVNPA